jgi:hypothetical protein
MREKQKFVSSPMPLLDRRPSGRQLVTSASVTRRRSSSVLGLVGAFEPLAEDQRSGSGSDVEHPPRRVITKPSAVTVELPTGTCLLREGS